MMNKQNGFTLVELAIALMVIGLLIGGVLKGQELIENARITQIARQIKAYEAAVTIFKGQYNTLPGDMKRPQSRLTNCDTDPCQLTGNGDRMIGSNETAGTDLHEGVNFWIHMDRAGLISGTNEEIAPMNVWFKRASPMNAFDGYTTLRWISSAGAWSAGMKAHRYTVSDNYDQNYHALSIMRTQRLDEKLDDGKPRSGSMRVNNGSVYGQVCYAASNVNEYIDNNTRRCHIWIEADGTN